MEKETETMTMPTLTPRRLAAMTRAGLLALTLVLIALVSCAKNNPTKVVPPGTVPVASVTVAPASATIVTGATTTLTATCKAADGDPITGRPVTWSSNHTNLATVDANGVVTGVAAGDVVITATCEGVNGGANITISAVPVASVTVTPASGTLSQGGTGQLTATPKDGSGTPLTGRVVTWSSDNTAVATVNASGRVTGVAAGSATITATCEGKTGTSAITVIVLPVASVTVSPASASVDAGSTVQLTATPKDGSGTPLTGRTVTWSSDNLVAATVNGSGLVTGVALGTATITATCEGKTGTSAITVTTAGTSVVMMGAGDIAIGDVYEAATAALIVANPSAVVFTAGDNAYDNGSTSDYAVYNNTWGVFKSRTHPCPGNHDYHTAGAADYFTYFGAQAGPAGRGYYSYDVGDWHIVSLDSEIDMSAGSPQETWLRSDLAASTKHCTLAYWHRPLFSSGDIHGNQTDTQPLWQALQDYHAEIIVCGHDHEYERFAPQDANGNADPVNGIREFVCGTGGANLYTITTLVPNSEAHNTSTYGVLKLTLGAGTYSWQFMPIPGGTFTDSGSGTCHN
jgi:acid phosphatase type 7